MFRYVALVWDAANPHASAAARRYIQRLKTTSCDWQAALDTPGLTVLYTGAERGTGEVYVLEGEAGVVLGKLFTNKGDQNGYGTVENLSVVESAKIVATKTRHLIDHYWGRYVAVVRDRDSRDTWVLRDPLGCVSCLTANYEGVNIFFSHQHECVPAGLLRLTLNERYIVARVGGSPLYGFDTAIKEIGQVVAGQCCTVRRNGQTQRTLYWEPTKIVREAPIEDGEEAARAIRKTAQDCIWSWARDFERILVYLSGGLDSSGMLGRLRKAPNNPRIDCTNYFDTSDFGDEREYARLAAQQAGCELIEVDYTSAEGQFELLRHLKRSHAPGNYHSALHYAEIERRVVQRTGSQVVFDGTYGDQLCCAFDQRDLFAYDYVLLHRPGREFVRVAAAAARSMGVCVWPFLAKGTWMYLFPSSRIVKTSRGGTRELVRPEVIAAARREKPQIHPWLQDLEGVPPGKQLQIKSFMGAASGNDVTGIGIGIPIVSVLFSQPLVKLALRIPTFVHNPYSAPRVTERQAFRDVLPEKITERTSKGIIDLSLAKQVAKHRKFLREFLLDGRMVQLGLLDREKLDSGLSEEHRLKSEGDSELMYEHLHTEAWLRSMEGELAEQPTLSGEWGAYIAACT